MFDRLKKWLLGEADHIAEQQLDQMAKKDSFLADALEGYRSVPEGDHARSVAELKARIRSKKERRPVGFSWTKVAAAAGLVGAIGLFFWLQQTPPQDGPIVQNTPSEEIQAPPVLKANDDENNQINKLESSVQDQSTVNDNNVVENTDFRPEPKTFQSAPVDPSNIEIGVMEEADLDIAEDQIAMADELEDRIEPVLERTNSGAESSSANKPATASTPAKDVTIFSIPPAPAELSEEEAEILGADDDITNRSDYASSERVEAEVLNKVSGLVVDIQSGEPVIGANVYIKDSEIGTVTGTDGTFTLESPKELPWEVVTNYIGHSNEVLTIDDAEQQMVVNLDTEDVLLDEVKVTGYAGKKKRSKAKTNAGPKVKSESSAPEPVIGFKKMKRYIRKNLDYPQTARLNQIQGTVTVRFFIDEDGRPQNITVLHGLGSGCDQEAIRLIKEGPKWKPSEIWAVYTVIFNL